MNSVDNSELAIRIQDFLDCTEYLLHSDWYFTQLSIVDEDRIHPNGTFLDPFPGQHFTVGKADNWGNRSSFLAAYSKLKAFAISEGLYVAGDE